MIYFYFSIVDCHSTVRRCTYTQHIHSPAQTCVLKFERSAIMTEFQCKCASEIWRRGRHDVVSMHARMSFNDLSIINQFNCSHDYEPTDLNLALSVDSMQGNMRTSGGWNQHPTAISMFSKISCCAFVCLCVREINKRSNWTERTSWNRFASSNEKHIMFEY